MINVEIRSDYAASPFEAKDVEDITQQLVMRGFTVNNLIAPTAKHHYRLHGVPVIEGWAGPKYSEGIIFYQKP